MKRSYKHWSRDEVVREVRRLKKEGGPLNSGAVAQTYPALAYASRKYLGGWEQAIEAAGLDYSKIRRKNFWNKKRIVEKIHELHKEEKPLYVSAAERMYGGLVGAATMYFGSWRKAMKSAGFDYADIKRQKEWSKKEIVREIKRMHREGLPLTTTIPVRKKYRTLHAASVRYFGSWAAAMKSAGLEEVLRR